MTINIPNIVIQLSIFPSLGMAYYGITNNLPGNKSDPFAAFIGATGFIYASGWLGHYITKCLGY